MPAPCPSAEQLQALLKANLPEAEQEKLAQHLEVCADCQRRLEAMTGGLTQALQQARRASPPPSPHLAEAMQKLQGDTVHLAQASADAMPAPPSLTVRYFGDYEILEELGRGGMGVVYKARQVSLNRTVAIKLILAGQLASPTEVRRFRTEAEAAAKLDHPHIVPIYEIGEHEGRHYFSMKLVECGSLAERSSEFRVPSSGLDGPVSNAERGTRNAKLARLMAQIARAVHYAHQRGVLHRDLKPSNILLDAQGQPHLTDFGLAKILEHDSSLTHSGAIMGTPNYLAPEVAAGKAKEVTTAADVFSLGAILYELLTGRPPFHEETVAATLQKVLGAEPALPCSLNPAVPRDLETVALKCLEKDPARRYVSAESLADDLDRFVRGEPILARPSTSLERMIKWSRRKPALAGSLAALGLAFVLGFAGVLWKWRGEVHQRHRAERESQRAQSAVNRLEVERAKSQAHNEEAARSDCAVAEVNLRDGQGRAALAHLARACKFDPLSTLAAEKAVVALNTWKYRLPSQILRGHMATVTSAQFSPDGSRIVTSALDHSARVWNAATGEPIVVMGKPATLFGYEGVVERIVHSVQFSPDGSRLVAASMDRTAQVWDVATGKVIATLSKNARSAQFSPDGTRIVSTSLEKTAQVWDAATGNGLVTLSGHGGTVRSAQFSPDGSRVVTASDDKTARVWDTVTGKSIATLSGHGATVRSAQFNPKGSRIVTASEDKTARAWDAATGNPIVTLSGHESPLEAAHFSPDGSRIATASEDKTARVWDAATGKVIVTLSGHEGGVRDVQFSPDGSRLVTASWDKTARIWHRATGQAMAILSGHEGRLETAQFSPDGSRVVTTSMDKTARVWDATADGTGEILTTLSGHKISVVLAQFSRKMSSVISFAGGQVWDVTGNELVILSGHERLAESLVSSMQFSPDGSRIVTTPRGGGALVRDAATRKTIVTLSGHRGTVRSAQFSPAGSRIVTAGEDKTARVWDAATGQAILTLSGHQDEVWDAQFSADGSHIVTASKDKTARVWDGATGQALVTLIGHQGKIETAQFSPNGSRIVTGSEDNTARVWDAATGKPIATLTGHEDRVRYGEFSPDGLRIVTASDDKTARVWDAATGRVLITLSGHQGLVMRAQFSPNGSRILTASFDRTARVWDVATGKAVVTLAAHKNGVNTAHFSPDASRIVTTSLDTTALVWTVLPPVAGPPPEWFADFLRYLAQMRLNPDGELETLQPDDWFALRERMRAMRRANAGRETPYLQVLRRFVTE
jgi:WD40 repeat protein/serine/threonine protein kinase